MLNKFKEFYKNTYGMLITLSWILLIVCLIIKLFGGNWFELNSDNSKFIEFCNYVETHQILKMSIACLIYLISGYFIISIIIKEKLKSKHFLIFYPLMILKSIISWYILPLAYILDLIIIVIIPIIITKNWKRVIITNVIIFIFQLITILIRNLSLLTGFNINNTVIENYLIQIDYYIMILLWYLYTFKRKDIKK